MTSEMVCVSPDISSPAARKTQMPVIYRLRVRNLLTVCGATLLYLAIPESRVLYL